MAILINKELSISGIPVPAGTMIKPAVHFPSDVLGVAANGKWDGKFTRRITYDNFIYSSKAGFQALEAPINGIKEIPAGLEKIVTNEEHAALMLKGELAEVWLRDLLNAILGGNFCSIIDPYSK